VAATHPRQHPRIARPYASIENTKGQPESQRFQLQRAEPDPALTLSAILCGSVACPRRARTLGRGAGGCDCWAMAPSPGFGCAWNTWIYHQEKSAQAPEIPEQKWGKRTQLSGDGTGRDARSVLLPPVTWCGGAGRRLVCCMPPAAANTGGKSPASWAGSRSCKRTHQTPSMSEA
jgi:hypothetical protein